MTTEDIFFQAMIRRDKRFDGKFFVGVKTTGIYCRPICPARPKRENVEFFSTAQAAQLAGYRACLRCRPEVPLNSPAWKGTGALVQRVLRHTQQAIELDEESFARRFGVGARHLRRLVVAQIGKTPKQIAFDSRLHLSHQLLVTTTLPVTQIAYNSGFQSIRRFNAAFKEKFKKTPSQIRQEYSSRRVS